MGIRSCEDCGELKFCGEDGLCDTCFKKNNSIQPIEKSEAPSSSPSSIGLACPECGHRIQFGNGEWPHPLTGSARSRILDDLNVGNVDEALKEISELKKVAG